jgi:hypothetical protein
MKSLSALSGPMNYVDLALDAKLGGKGFEAQELYTRTQLRGGSVFEFGRHRHYVPHNPGGVLEMGGTRLRDA